MPSRLGIEGVPADGQKTPSEIAGYIILVGIMLFASVEASRMIGFENLAMAIEELIALGANVILALVILGVGVYLANIAHSAILSTAGETSAKMAMIARFAILVFVAAMALQQVDLGQAIIETAFQALVYAIAIAAAIAFGWGGRHVAEEAVGRWAGAGNGDAADDAAEASDDGEAAAAPAD